MKLDGRMAWSSTHMKDNVISAERAVDATASTT